MNEGINISKKDEWVGDTGQWLSSRVLPWVVSALPGSFLPWEAGWGGLVTHPRS